MKSCQGISSWTIRTCAHRVLCKATLLVTNMKTYVQKSLIHHFCSCNCSNSSTPPSSRHGRCCNSRPPLRPSIVLVILPNTQRPPQLAQYSCLLFLLNLILCRQHSSIQHIKASKPSGPARIRRRWWHVLWFIAHSTHKFIQQIAQAALLFARVRVWRRQRRVFGRRRFVGILVRSLDAICHFQWAVLIAWFAFPDIAFKITVGVGLGVGVVADMLHAVF